jgi:hypothetical protein
MNRTNWGTGNARVGRPTNEYLDWHTCQIERNVYRRIKLLSVKRDVNIRDLLTEALEEYLLKVETHD